MTRNHLEATARDVVDELVRAWAAGDGAAFARPFADHAHFVAFDGTVLRGPDEIGRFHQQAFSTHLAGTRLQVHLEEVRTLAPGIAVVLTRGGIQRDGKSRGALMGHSIQTYVMTERDGRARIESFQNTRDRPITGPRQAQVWRDFDQAWDDLT
jgi:uncharacterized protein (TIGR02246 family)